MSTSYRIAFLIFGVALLVTGFTLAKEVGWTSLIVIAAGAALVGVSGQPTPRPGGYANEHKGPPARSPTEPPVRSVREQDERDFTEEIKRLETRLRMEGDMLLQMSADYMRMLDEKDREVDRLNRRLAVRAQTVEVAGLVEETAFIAEIVKKTAGMTDRTTLYIGTDNQQASSYLKDGATVRMIRVWALPDGRLAWRDNESYPTLRIINQETQA